MKIKRTFKPVSLKAGQVVFVNESIVRLVAGQTMVAHHNDNECKPEGYEGPKCYYCAIPAMNRLFATGKLETYFSLFEVVNDDTADQSAAARQSR